jgi:hypothetical protein
MMTVTVQETCYFCKKSLVEDEWVWVCMNCGTTWCNEHKKTEFKWSAWSGLAKENCPNCGFLLKDTNVEILPKFSDWRERFGVKPAEPEPEAVQPAAGQAAAAPAADAEPQTVAAVQKPEQAVPQPAAPPAPKKPSIVGAVLMLIPFGALTIFGFVSLFTLWEEGFYWILMSLGCIGFGGRISIASIQEIGEYFQQKKAADAEK